MSRRGYDFLDRWIVRNVRPTPAHRLDAEAQRLTEQCITEAREAGIPETELVEDLQAGLLFEMKRQIRECPNWEISGDNITKRNS